MPIDALIRRLEAGASRDIATFEALLRDLVIDAALVARYMPDPMPSSDYHRNLLHHGDDFEVVIATWPAGGGTPIHDHGSADSHGMVRVLKGAIYNHVYRREGDNVVRVAELEASAGDLIKVPRGLVHAMGNHGDEVGMSLHLYSPVIENVSYWDPATLEPMEFSLSN